MDVVRFQAHRGVSTEFPENTLSAIRAAVLQGYDIIEIDPSYTKDGTFVLLHDKTINRTARTPSGEALPREMSISDLSYSEASFYDYGVWFSAKYRGESLPALEKVLIFAEMSGVTLKLDNKIQFFPEKVLSHFFDLLKTSSAHIAFTSNNTLFIQKICDNFSNCEIHYDGTISDDILISLKNIVGQRPLTVWIPYDNTFTSFSSLPKADQKLCDSVRKYADLGIWLITKDCELDTAVNVFGASVIETNGSLKPKRRLGVKADTHTHTDRSHDSRCGIDSLARSAIKKGIDIVTITNHCDIMEHPTPNAVNDTLASVQDAIDADKRYGGRVKFMCGAEIGEGFADVKLTEKILGMCDYDAIVGSVHAVRWRGLDKVYYSGIDFSAFSVSELHEYLDAYFEDVLYMLKAFSCDILAHLTCPLRYINGKYRRGITLESHNVKIKNILEYIIRHGVALEINTSGIGGPLDDFMPNADIIKLYREMGGYLITIGSDSHTENGVGNGFGALFQKLKDLKIQDYFYFEKRVAQQCRII